MTKRVRATVSGVISILRSDLGSVNLDPLLSRLTFANPKFRGAIARARGDMTRLRFEGERELRFFSESRSRIEIPRGCAGTLSALARQHGSSIEWIDERVTAPASFNLRAPLRPYQNAAALKMRRAVQAVGVVPCGGGKTWIGMGLIAAAGQRAAVLVPSVDLARQWSSTCEEALGVRAGSLSDPDADVCVGTIQSVMSPSFSPSLCDRFGTLIVDEVHHVPAETFSEAMPRFPARFRFGLTATHRRDDGVSPVIPMTIGDIVHRSSYEDLIEGGFILPVTFCYLESKIRFRHSTFQGLLAAVAKNERRNRMIASLAERLATAGRRVMITAMRKSHLRSIMAMMPDGMRTFLHGGATDRQRERMLRGMREGEIRVMFATSAIANEGLDLPSLDTIISASAGRASITATQQPGRLTRRSPGKVDPMFIEIVDRGDMPEDHAEARRRVHARAFGRFYKVAPSAR